MIKSGLLRSYYFTDRHNEIAPALVLIFDSPLHPVMPIRVEHWDEYLFELPDELREN